MPMLETLEPESGRPREAPAPSIGSAAALKFGRRPSFEERYNTDHIFDPLGKPPGVR